MAQGQLKEKEVFDPVKRNMQLVSSGIILAKLPNSAGNKVVIHTLHGCGATVAGLLQTNIIALLSDIGESAQL